MTIIYWGLKVTLIQFYKLLLAIVFFFLFFFLDTKNLP